MKYSFFYWQGANVSNSSLRWSIVYRLTFLHFISSILITIYVQIRRLWVSNQVGSDTITACLLDIYFIKYLGRYLTICSLTAQIY
jgi:hypothetical protein